MEIKMREFNRIERILYKLGKLWVKCPDTRLYQLLINYGGLEDTFYSWNLEDDIIEIYLDKALKRVYKGKKK